MKKWFKIEKSSQSYLAIAVLLLALSLIFTSLGKQVWNVYVTATFSIILGLLLWSEAGLAAWWNRSGYKKFSLGDIVVIASAIFGTFLLLNGIYLSGVLGSWFPEPIASFVRTNALVGGGVAGLLAVFFLFSGKPKA